MADRHVRVQGTETRDSGVKRCECAANPAGDKCYFVKTGLSWRHMKVDIRSGVSNAPRRLF